MLVNGTWLYWPEQCKFCKKSWTTEHCERYVYEVAISEYLTVERIEEAYDNYIKQKEQDEYESNTEYKMTIKEYKALTSQLQRIEELCKRNAR